jgi:hypothetical protein
MKQRQPYTRISDLVASHRGPEFAPNDCQRAVTLIEKVFRCIDDMPSNEREVFMKRVAGWAIGTKFSSEKAPVLVGLHRYCVAANLIQNPAWQPPKFRL